jgi:hypothetical protein
MVGNCKNYGVGANQSSFPMFAIDQSNYSQEIISKLDKKLTANKDEKAYRKEYKAERLPDNFKWIREPF